MRLSLFQNILGQSDAINWLRTAYQEDHLPHGLIFAGPRGVGKGTTADALAAVYLCHQPNAKTVAPCGKCDSCKLLAAGNHPDFARVYRQLRRLEKKDVAAKELVVDVIRQFVVAPANLKPALGHGKVFVVEEAELMNAAAQNSLLKTLEEPFGKTLMLLLSDHAQSLLPTIQSRTQTVRFGALDESLVTKELLTRGVDAATAKFAAEISEGSIGAALDWIRDDVVLAAQELLGQLDHLLAGKPPENLADWFKSASEAYAKKQTELDENASVDQSKREGLSLYLRIAAQRFRRVLRESNDAGTLDQACTALEAIAKADDYLDANVNIPIVFQQLAQTLIRLAAA